MRITDQQIYALANTNIQTARQEQAIAQGQVSSGKAVVHPWDDAGNAGLVAVQANQIERQGALASVAGRASDELTAADGAMDQVTTTLTRAHELAVQLANDTYNASDRANGAVEVQQLFAAVVSQLNVKAGDRYVFGGMRDGAPPFTAAGAYVGDANVRQVEIAPGLMQDASIRADQAFKGSGGGIDVLTELTTLQTALSTNNAVGIRAAVQSLGDGITQVSNFRARAGGMQNVFDVAQASAQQFGNSATDSKSKLEDADFFAASTRLAAAQTGLQATLSAAAQSFKLSLLDKL
jgi:flagellar hook-associated protein 3 FlgL